MKNFIDAFFETVRTYPDNTAVIDKKGFYTYTELERKSNLLAHGIIEKARAQGIDIPTIRAEGKNGIRVVVLLPRTKDFLIAVIGILRAGCAVVPIDTEYPEGRINFILEDSDAYILVTDRNNSEKANFSVNRIIFIEDIVSSDISASSLPEYNYSDLDIEGLLIYTSGSTGRPKGVIHTQNIFNYGISLLHFLGYSQQSRLCCMSSFTFLISVVDLIPALMFGGSVYIADTEERKDVYSLYHTIIEKEISGMYMPPALYTVMESLFGTLPFKYVLVAGEKLKFEKSESDFLYESYGTTETALALIHKVHNGESPNLLGQAIPEVSLFLRDEQGKQIETPGVIGELCIISPFVALGYNKLPEETERYFTSSPFDERRRMFRTGDYFSLDEDGKYYFHGRRDRMIKLSGYRIELNEIETVMQSLPEVKDNAVIRVKVNEVDKIACYYCLNDKRSSVDADYFKSALGKKLTEYMIPEYIIELDEIPRNANGKKDYLKLQSMEIKRNPYIAPRTELEEKFCSGFADILNIPRDKVGIDDDFFAIGGDSISSRQLINYMGLTELTVTLLLQARTPRVLCELYEKKLNENKHKVDRETLNQIALREEIPLTGYQFYLLDHQLYTPLSTMLNIGFFFKIGDKLDLHRFTFAVNTALKHHPIFTSKIVINDEGEFCLKYFPELFTPVEIEEISEAEFMQVKEGMKAPYTLVNSLLYVCRIFKTPTGNYFFFDTHHTISDGTSLQLFFSNVKRAYMGENLAPDHLFLLLKEKAQIKQQELETKWKKYIAENYKGIPWTTMIEPDHTSRENAEDNVKAELDIFDAKLKEAMEKYQISANIFYMTVTLLAYGKATSDENILLRTMFNGRESIEKEAMFGPIAPSVPVGVQLKKEITIAKLFEIVNTRARNAQELDDSGFWEFFKEEYGIKEIFSYIYQREIYNYSTTSEFPLELMTIPNHYRAALLLFKVEVHEEDGKRSFNVRYMSTRYERKRAEEFVQNFLKITSTLLEADPNMTVGDVLA